VLVVVASVLALLSVVPLGGQLGRLARLRLRLGWVPVACLALQVLIISVVPGAPHRLLAATHVATYVAAGVFVLVNWRVPGLLLLGAGAASNGITIAANGGTLPARPAALASAGIHVTPGEFANSAALAHPHLAWLGDVFAWPEPMPLHNTFSVGDLLIVLGVVVGAHVTCGSRLDAPLSRLGVLSGRVADVMLPLPADPAGQPSEANAFSRIPRPSSSSGSGMTSGGRKRSTLP
jgi:hypothetical protein